MKQLVLLLFLCPLWAGSQQLQSDFTDDFGKVRRLATTRIEFKGFTNSLGGTLKISPSDTTLFLHLIFYPGKPTAVTEESKAVLWLADNSQLVLRNTGARRELQRNESGTLVLPLTPADRARLRDARVVGYKIATGKTAVEVALTDHQQSAFARTIQLLEAGAHTPWPDETYN